MTKEELQAEEHLFHERQELQQQVQAFQLATELHEQLVSEAQSQEAEIPRYPSPEPEPDFAELVTSYVKRSHVKHVNIFCITKPGNCFFVVQHAIKVIGCLTEIQDTEWYFHSC